MQPYLLENVKKSQSSENPNKFIFIEMLFDKLFMSFSSVKLVKMNVDNLINANCEFLEQLLSNL